MAERQGRTRRGILAAAGAVVAGIAMKQASQPVAAAFTTSDYYYAAGTAYIGFDASTNGSFSVGVSGKGSIYGVVGYGGGGTGVYGTASSGPSKGVYGQHTGGGYGVYGEGTNGHGVYGTVGDGGYGVTGIATNSLGVLGQSTSGVGVQGQILGAAANTVAVTGSNQSTGAGGVGVFGQSATGYGVLGQSIGGSASLAGISTNANIPAFAGGNSVAGGLAASFSGTVYVNGMFVVADMTQKHGLLKHPDGSHRLMYTVEAPESWAEDFGTGTLVGGKADVKLDPDFAALIHTEDYHVFVTGREDSNGLYVTGHSATGFTVREHKGGVSNLTFSWRVVAKPKSDRKVERLGKFVVPHVPLPDVTKLPKPETPTLPKKP